MAKLLNVKWSEMEACSYYIDKDKYSKAHDHGTYLTLNSFSGTYTFNRNDGRVTLDTGVEKRNVSVEYWFISEDGE